MISLRRILYYKKVEKKIIIDVLNISHKKETLYRNTKWPLELKTLTCGFPRFNERVSKNNFEPLDKCKNKLIIEN